MKSIPTLDASHRGALARALTDEGVFADASRVDDSTLKDTVALSGRSGELHQSFLHFLKSNPRALEQLHPAIVNGIFESMESPRVAFDDISLSRRSRDFKVGAFAALATLFLSVVGYAGWGVLRPHRNDAGRVAEYPPIYQTTPNPATLQQRNVAVHAPVRRSTPPIQRGFVKQVVVKDVQSQSVPAKPSTATPFLPRGVAARNAAPRHDPSRQRAATPQRSEHHVAISAINNHLAKAQRPDQPAASRARSEPVRGTSLPSSQLVIAAIPKATVAVAAPIAPTVPTPAPVLTPRDFVASTIKAAAPDTKITSLWVSDGGGDLTVVEAESANRSGTFYDKYVVRSSRGSFLITSHDQIPVSPSGERAATPPPAIAGKKPRALFGHIRHAHP